MNKNEFIKYLQLAASAKTLYVSGGFGHRLNAANKKQLAKMYPKNASRPGWAEATGSTYGFDCIGLIKGILWGWCGSASLGYGGAQYKSNNVPDLDETKFFNKCLEISDDFSKIERGEMVWMTGHCGVYIGDGLVIESSPAWKNGVQITACNQSKVGYNMRTWLKHGKIPYIEYEEVPTVLEWQKAAILDGFAFPKYGADGEWGAECESVAKQAIVKYRPLVYRNKNLTKVVQTVVGVEVDGLCGKATKAAIIAYQTKHGLDADGEVGLNTWKCMLHIK